jgi:hypothetical protein
VKECVFYPNMASISRLLFKWEIISFLIIGDSENRKSKFLLC